MYLYRFLFYENSYIRKKGKERKNDSTIGVWRVMHRIFHILLDDHLSTALAPDTVSFITI